MIDMSKYFLRITTSAIVTEPLHKKARNQLPVKLGTQLVISGCKQNVSLERFLISDGNKTIKIPIDFGTIPELENDRMPFGSQPGSISNLHQWPKFKYYHIPPVMTEIEEILAGIAIIERNIKTLEELQKYLTKKVTSIENSRRFSSIAVPSSPLGDDVVTDAQLVALELSKQMSYMSAARIAERIMKTQRRVTFVIEFLCGLGLVVRNPQRNCDEKTKLEVTTYKWNTQMEVVWTNLVFFVKFYLVLREQRQALVRAEENLEKIVRQEMLSFEFST